jgi:hypothetical protein
MKHEWPIDTKVGPITQALIDGKARLVERGWCKYKMVNEAGALCLEGSLRAGKCQFEVERELRDALPEYHRNLRWILPEYNDHPYTTLADVLALYDRAIASARSRGI